MSLNFEFQGVAVNTFNLKDEMYSLVYGGKVPAQGFDGSESRLKEYRKDPQESNLFSLFFCFHFYDEY